MDIHVDIRGVLETHAWICHGFSDQGSQSLLNTKEIREKKNAFLVSTGD